MSNWQSWIGRTTTTAAWLDPAQANRMAATLDREHVFRAGDLLRPAWHWLYFHDIVAASALGHDGHPALGVVMPPVPLLLGDGAERTTVIRSITPKRGRSGPMFFVTVEHTLRTGNTLNLVEEQTIVYRELTDTSTTTIEAPTEATFSRQYALDTTALFRYSALTFNGHRIHYDADYARTVEGYPNLVIHGPLIATLLLDLCAAQGRPLGQFRYRARSPLFLPHPFIVNGKADGGTTMLWASSHDGRLAMEAEALPTGEQTNPEHGRCSATP